MTSQKSIAHLIGKGLAFVVLTVLGFLIVGVLEGDRHPAVFPIFRVIGVPAGVLILMLLWQGLRKK